MKRIRVSCIILWAFAAFYASSLFGAVPQMISYQGRLTDIAGAPVNDTVDLVFDICADSLCSRPLWEESQKGVIVKDGLFAVLLGSNTPIPPSVFSGSARWLSISKDGVTASRALRMVSVPYAYSSLLADTAYYAKNGGGTDCSDCDVVFVNAIGPDSVISTSGTALAGKVVGSGSADVFGLKGYASNKGIGAACGGIFTTADSGSGVHFGVRAEAYGNSSSLVQGIIGYGSNTSTGEAYGGYFATPTSGTGVHYGLRADAMGGLSSAVYGIYGWGSNSSAGSAYGGFFSAPFGGTGFHYGLRAEGSSSSSSPTYGTSASAENTSSGSAIGGWFETANSGTGAHYGVRTETYGSSAAASYGVSGWASNTSTGNAYGGDFSTNIGGTGQHYGVRGSAYASSFSSTYGAYGYGSNTSAGGVCGGLFVTAATGTGIHYGAKLVSDASSANQTFGLYSQATNSSTGEVYGGLFDASGLGTGTHYGVYSISDANSTIESYGVVTKANNNSSGIACGINALGTSFGAGATYGGYFRTSTTGTGYHYGVVGMGNNDDDATSIGVYGYAQNSGSKNASAYGGYFSATSGLFGAGVFGAGTSTAWGGYFTGGLWVSDYELVSGDLTVQGSKNAAVKIDNGEYRLVSCQESPEVWFEDFGEGQLSNGRTHIELDPLFLQTVTIDSRHPIKVFVQLEGDCRGVYVSKGITGFDVNELQGGIGNVSFSYRVVAKRKGYEDVRLARMQGPSPEEMKAQSARVQDEMEKERAKMEEENSRMDQAKPATDREPAQKENE